MLEMNDWVHDSASVTGRYEERFTLYIRATLYHTIPLASTRVGFFCLMAITRLAAGQCAAADKKKDTACLIIPRGVPSHYFFLSINFQENGFFWVNHDRIKGHNDYNCLVDTYRDAIHDVRVDDCARLLALDKQVYVHNFIWLPSPCTTNIAWRRALYT